MRGIFRNCTINLQRVRYMISEKSKDVYNAFQTKDLSGERCREIIYKHMNTEVMDEKNMQAMW